MRITVLEGKLVNPKFVEKWVQSLSDEGLEAVIDQIALETGIDIKAMSEGELEALIRKCNLS